MSNSDSDKTKIAPPRLREEKDASRAPGAGDKSAASAEDKTRIGAVKRSGGEGQQEQSDATRYAPRQRLPEDKTRIKQPPPRRDGTAELKAGAEASHEVLKGRFVLEKVLGSGGMGVVYRAKDLLKVEAQDRDPYVAIKVLNEEFKTHPAAFIALQRESRKSQRIAHPNIVSVYDFDRHGETVFMTMEYMEGTSLDKLIKQYKTTGLPADDAWAIIQGVSLALAHAHAENIVHSDFKPGNVFVTNKGIAKVFDFGISRAVAIAEHVGNNSEDKTLFDAGTLGALTPAYASREMLQGKRPDVRDDIFALGCVAYEMLTGVHPYNRVPADEAEKQKLKPKRIKGIKKHQWKAIEKAIALRSEDRTASVNEFVASLSAGRSTKVRVSAVLALILTLGVAVYLALVQEKTVDPLAEFNIRNELELKVKIDFYKEHLSSLLQSPSFDEDWQAAVWKDVSDLMKLTRNKDPWVIERKLQVYQMYLSQIDEAIRSVRFDQARRLLVAARRYVDDPTDLERRSEVLARAMAEADAKKAREVELANQSRIEKAAEEEAMRARQAELENQKRLAAEEKAKAEPPKPKGKMDLFDMALANVNLQLKCQGRLNMSDFESAVNKLREIDHGRYQKLEGRIVAALGDCIGQIGKAFPARASEAKKQGLRIFNGNAYLANIEIRQRDVCDVSLAGLGANGYRAICKDKVGGNGVGPELVVIPGQEGMPPFAIGKYEVSIGELNLFCKASSQCRPIAERDESLPASNISFDLANKYLRWLSETSGQKYRLPTLREWGYAAGARRKALDPNRNCRLSARGIEKGDGPVRSDMGAQNDWGLVNYVGNVQEWVYDKGRNVVAAGGSFGERMDSCNVDTVNSQGGNADMYTGFRVLREIRPSS